MARRARARAVGAPSEPAPRIARNEAILGLTCGLVAAVGAVLWQVAIPLAVVALAVSWFAASRARGVDLRSVGLAVAGIATGGVALILASLVAVLGSDGSDDRPATMIDGIESSTPDDTNPPQHDLEAGTRCTVDLSGLRADGAIVNRSDQPWRYRVRVVWEEDDREIDDATSLLDAIAPAGRAEFRVVSPITGSAATTCRVAQIDRLHP